MNISFIQIVLLRYTSTRTRFVLSFFSGSRTIVVRNIIPVWMSLYHITIVNSSCAIELLKAIFCVPCIIFIKSPSFTLNRFRRQALTPYIWFIQVNHWSPFKDIFPLRLWLPPLAIKWSTSQDSRVYSLWVRAFLHRLIQSMWFFFCDHILIGVRYLSITDMPENSQLSNVYHFLSTQRPYRFILKIFSSKLSASFS